jgi:hypothetical protein
VRAIPSVADLQRLRLPPVCFMIQRFLGEGISPTPRREVVADHMQAGSRRERCQASRKVSTIACIPGATAIRPAAPPGWQLHPVVWEAGIRLFVGT